jgi:kynurenine formamidase
VDLRADGIQIGQPAGRHNPILTFTALNQRDKMAPGIWTGTDDLVTMSTCAGTHIDALCHVGYDGRLYNDRPISTITPSTGATWCGAEKLPAIATRGVLLDIPRSRGVDRLDAGTAIGADDLDAACEAARVEIASGDAICVRTGEMQWYRDGERARYATGEDWKNTGLGVSAIEWFGARDVAAVFCDNYTYEVMPPESGNWDDLLAVHMIQLRDMGLLQGQNWDFEALAAAVADDGAADFLLVASPEPIVGATSAPVAPVAIR